MHSVVSDSVAFGSVSSDLVALGLAVPRGGVRFGNGWFIGAGLSTSSLVSVGLGSEFNAIKCRRCSVWQSQCHLVWGVLSMVASSLASVGLGGFDLKALVVGVAGLASFTFGGSAFIDVGVCSFWLVIF